VQPYWQRDGDGFVYDPDHMIDRNRSPHRSSVTALLAIVACLGLAACGGSSGSNSASVSTSAAVQSSASTAAAATTSAASTTSAAKSTPVVGTPHHLSAAAYRALSRYAACMRSHGVDLPPPSRAGDGPIFDLSHADTGSAVFSSSSLACRHFVNGIL